MKLTNVVNSNVFKIIQMRINRKNFSLKIFKKRIHVKSKIKFIFILFHFYYFRCRKDYEDQLIMNNQKNTLIVKVTYTNISNKYSTDILEKQISRKIYHHFQVWKTCSDRRPSYRFGHTHINDSHRNRQINNSIKFNSY